MRFAIRNNELYAKVHHLNENRGWHVLYGLLSLLRHQRVPDVYGTFTTVTGDFPEDPEIEEDAGSHFAFWREPGAELPPLWPDFDVWGWALKWIPPLELVAAQFAAEMIPWDARSPTVFFGGRIIHSSDPQHTSRAQFAECAAGAPSLMTVNAINWTALEGGPDVPVLGRARIKPVAADLRALMRHKYLIDFPGHSWSTGVKRMLFAGAALLLPHNAFHESLVGHTLKECDKCVLYYDIHDVCRSVKAVLEETSDDEARATAERLRAFARERFSADALEKVMHSELVRASKEQDFAAGWALMLRGEDKVEPPKVRCAWLKAKHREQVGPEYAWQIDEWFDDNCETRTTKYLTYMAI